MSENTTKTEDKDNVRPLNPDNGMPLETDIQQATEEELAFLKDKTDAYKAQGIPEQEAIQMAAADWKIQAEKREEMANEAWDAVTKKVGLAEFHDDIIRRTLGIYKTKWHKANPGYTLDFRLKLSALGGGKIRGIIMGVQLVLEVAINGSWEVWRKKEINFTHMRDLREGHKWKLALYEAMTIDLITWGVTHMLNIKTAQTFKVKPQPEANGEPKGESTPN